MNYRNAEPHYVYRVFDDQGVLLYVGCTVDVERRLFEHGWNRAPWVPFKAEVRVMKYHTRPQAMAIEDLLIRAHYPVFNVAARDRSEDVEEVPHSSHPSAVPLPAGAPGSAPRFEQGESSPAGTPGPVGLGGFVPAMRWFDQAWTASIFRAAAWRARQRKSQ